MSVSPCLTSASKATLVPRALPLVTCLMILSACVPVLDRQLSSRVNGIITSGGVTVEGAGIGIGQEYFDVCMKYKPKKIPKSRGLTLSLQPLPKAIKIDDESRLALPISTFTDEKGRFTVNGETKKGLSLLNLHSEPLNKVTICVRIEDYLYWGEVFYLAQEPWQELDVECDVMREEMCKLAYTQSTTK